MAGPFGLDFEPADRTKGGYEYQIGFCVPDPTSAIYKTIGCVKVNGKWVVVSWNIAGIEATGRSGFDLVPKPQERWGNVKPKICFGASWDDFRVHWHDTKELADDVAKDRAFLLHEIRQGDDVRYEIVDD